jgi:hypothetical protein
MLLINKEQVMVIDLIIEILEQKIKQRDYVDFTQTVIPCYDSVLSKDRKKFLQQVKMSPLCSAKVSSLNQQTLLSEQESI